MIEQTTQPDREEAFTLAMNDPIRFCVALVPFAIYVLILGVINTRKRTVVLSGHSDFCMLAFGISGFVLIGPMELLAPIDAFNAFGVITWGMLICLFSLSVSLYVLISHPSLVLYKIDSDQFQQTFTEILEKNNWAVEYAGTTVSLPDLKIDFSYQAQKGLDTICLSPVSNSQNYDGWTKFSGVIRLGFRGSEIVQPAWKYYYSWKYYLFSMALFLAIGLSLFYNQETLKDSFHEFLRYHPS